MTVPNKTDRLFIRAWSPDDWEQFKPIATDPKMLRYIGRTEPWSDQRIQTWVKLQIDRQRNERMCRWKLVDKESGRVIGFCGLAFYGTTGQVEIGYWVARDLWGRGLATEAARAVLRYGLDTLKLERIISVAVPENRASIRVMKKIGLTFAEETTTAALGLDVDLPCVVYAIVGRGAE